MSTDLTLSISSDLFRFHDVDYNVVSRQVQPHAVACLPVRIFRTTFPATDTDDRAFREAFPDHAPLSVRTPNVNALTHVLRAQNYESDSLEDAFGVLGLFHLPLEARLALAKTGSRLYSTRTMYYGFGLGGTGKSLVHTSLVSGLDPSLIANYPSGDRAYPTSEVYHVTDDVAAISNTDLSTDPSMHGCMEVLKKISVGEATSVTAKNRQSKSWENDTATVLLTANMPMPISQTCDKAPFERRTLPLPFGVKLRAEDMDVRVGEAMTTCAGDTAVHCIRAYHGLIGRLEAADVTSSHLFKELSADYQLRNSTCIAVLIDEKKADGTKSLSVQDRALLVRACFEPSALQVPIVPNQEIKEIIDNAVHHARESGDPLADAVAAVYTDDLMAGLKLPDNVFVEAGFRRVKRRQRGHRGVVMLRRDNPDTNVLSLFRARLDAMSDNNGLPAGDRGLALDRFLPGDEPEVFAPLSEPVNFLNVWPNYGVTWVEADGTAADSPIPVRRRPAHLDSPVDAAPDAPANDASPAAAAADLAVAAALDGLPAVPTQDPASPDGRRLFSPEPVAVAAAPPRQLCTKSPLPDNDLNTAVALLRPASIGPRVVDAFLPTPEPDSRSPSPEPTASDRPPSLPFPEREPICTRSPPPPDAAPLRPVSPSRPPANLFPLTGPALKPAPAGGPPANTGRTLAAAGPPPAAAANRPSDDYPDPNTFRMTTWFSRPPYDAFYGMPDAGANTRVSGCVQGVFVSGSVRNYVVRPAQSTSIPRINDADGIMKLLPSCPTCKWTLVPFPFKGYPNWKCARCFPGKQFQRAPTVRDPIWPPNSAVASGKLADDFTSSTAIREIGLSAVRKHLASNRPGSVAQLTRHALLSQVCKVSVVWFVYYFVFLCFVSRRLTPF